MTTIYDEATLVKDGALTNLCTKLQGAMGLMIEALELKDKILMHLLGCTEEEFPSRLSAYIAEKGIEL